jgi:hypothetical protein
LVRSVGGERFDETTAYVEVSLWDPPFRDVFDEYREFEVAGRLAHSADDADNQFSCMVDVDNGDYFIHVNVERASGEGVLVCEVAASLASTAVSAID